MQENQHRLTQASNTPSLSTSQIHQLGWTADQKIAKAILDNTLHQHDHNLHETILDLAPFLTTPTAIDDLGTIDTTVSRTEYRSAWSKCR
jgi:hypothetical protein